MAVSIGTAASYVGSIFAGTSSFGAAGAAVASGVTSAGVGAGVSSALAKSPNIKIPPPPGAAMVDPQGSSAAAAIRQRQATAGGLNSTVGAGGQPGAQASFGGATSGAKQLLGQ